MTTTHTPDRLVDRPSALEAECDDIIHTLGLLLALLTSDTASPIVQEVAAVLASEWLADLHALDTADDLRDITPPLNKENTQ